MDTASGVAVTNPITRTKPATDYPDGPPCYVCRAPLEYVECCRCADCAPLWWCNTPRCFWFEEVTEEQRQARRSRQVNA